MVLFIVILEAGSSRETRMFFRSSRFVLKLTFLFIHDFPLNIMKIILPVIFVFVFYRPLVFCGIPHAQWQTFVYTAFVL